MTTLARDASNYTIDLTPEMLQAWKARGVGLVLIQAFPPSYATKYAEQRQQMRLCAQEGMPFDVYIYDYLGAPDWLDGALEGLTRAQNEEGLLPRKLWIDEEDLETEEGWTPGRRTAAILNSLERLDGWTQPRGLPPAGIYTGAWWWVPKTSNAALTERPEVPLWDADYRDGIPDADIGFTPYGRWSSRRIKQYAGTQPDGTDLNVLSTDEEAELGGTPPMDDAERTQLQDKINGLVNSLGYISADLLAPVARQKSGSKAVQKLVAGIRDQADQHGINHA